MTRVVILLSTPPLDQFLLNDDHKRLVVFELLRSGSGVWSEKGLDYGGIDEGGELEPAARRRHTEVWYDEDDDEG